MSQIRRGWTVNHLSSSTWLAGILLVTLAVRGSVLLCRSEGLRHDTDAYRRIAETLRTTGTFGYRVSAADAPAETAAIPTAFRPPLYPLILSWLSPAGELSIVAVGVFHLFCGIATVAVVWNLARNWGLERHAVWAALFVCCDPILLHQSTQLMTETLATLLAALALWVLTRWQRRPANASAFQVGLLLGLACLCRPTFLPWSGLILLAGLAGKRNMTAKIRSAAAMLAGIVLVLSPWGIRNYQQFGRVQFTTTHGGYTLLLGNNPSYYRFFRASRWGGVWDSRELSESWQRRDRLRDATEDLFALTPTTPSASPTTATGDSLPKSSIIRDEFDDDRLAYELATRYCREDPAAFVSTSLDRILSLWQMLPRQLQESESLATRIARWMTACWYVAVFAGAATGAWQLKGRLFATPWVWGVTMCLTFTMVHAVYWSNMRMRAPCVPFIVLLATLGLAALVDRRRAGYALDPPATELVPPSLPTGACGMS